jgi:hypothetical protein
MAAVVAYGIESLQDVREETDELKDKMKRTAISNLENARLGVKRIRSDSSRDTIGNYDKSLSDEAFRKESTLCTLVVSSVKLTRNLAKQSTLFRNATLDVLMYKVTSYGMKDSRIVALYVNTG